MLKLTVPAAEFFNEATSEFIETKETVLQLEHSLISISKWESKWKKPFLSNSPKTVEETIDYIRCMTINQNVDPYIYRSITQAMVNRVTKYIDDPMTATTIKEDPAAPKGNRVTWTSEVIYYYMTEFNIPFECERWHLNRLIMLIRVCSEKNKDPKKNRRKMSAKDRQALNASRLKKYNTSG
jgi:hypothetical protein